jgi:hypothetical protein
MCGVGKGLFQEREEIIVYECTSHPSNTKTLK